MTPSEPQTKAGKALLEATAEWTGTIEISREFLIDRILAIEREAQGIPPSEALRPVKEWVAAHANHIDHFPFDGQGDQTFVDADELDAFLDTLAAIPSGGIPLITQDELDSALEEAAYGEDL